mgnify:CR=1 FL=1
MKNAIGNCRQRKAVLFALALPLMFSGSPAQAMHRSEIVREVTQQNLKIVSAKKNQSRQRLKYLFSNNQRMTFDSTGKTSSEYFRTMPEESSVIRKQNLKHKFW